MPARTNTAAATTPPVKSAGQRNPALDRVLPSLDFNAPAEMQLQAMQRAKDYLATQVGERRQMPKQDWKLSMLTRIMQNFN
jgi:hypothetical protein